MSRAPTRAPFRRRSDFNLPDLVRRLVRRVQYLAAERGQTIELTNALKDPLVRGDSMLVGRALRNFLDNAFTHAPQNTPVRVVLREANEHVEMRVEDAGSNMPVVLRDKIFEPFFQAGSARARPSHGLGLALCARVARVHGGKAWVEAGPSGNGNAFCLRIPHH